jgi:threonine/homoserine/homoserine lactone efflux protein
MLLTFLQGVGFGLTLQLSVGPVCLAVLHQSLTGGFAAAWRMTWGVACVDALYMLAALAGASAYLRIVALKQVVLVAGAAVLVYFGVRQIRTAGSAVPEAKRTKTGGFLFGAGITLTNPLTVLFWSGVFGALIASGALKGAGELLLFSLGCLFATVMFLSLVSAFGSTAKRLLRPPVMRWLDRFAGGLLILFGCLLLVR